MEYRNNPSKRCPYLLVTTPEPHYAGFMYKAAEVVLLNRFGERNIPRGAFWKMSETSTEITDAFNKFKAPWGLFKALGVLKKHGHSEDAILMMLKARKIKFPTIKYIGSYKFWCQQQKEMLKKMENAAKSRYNKDEIVIEDNPVVDIEKEKDTDNLRDWLD